MQESKMDRDIARNKTEEKEQKEIRIKEWKKQEKEIKKKKNRNHMTEERNDQKLEERTKES